MITELRVQNARIYDQRDWKFPLTGLTILCGTNSAGKSTILKCLLLLRQNLLYRDPSLNLQSGPRLRFSNALTDLGNFRSFVSHNDTAQELHLGVTIETAMDADNYELLAPDEIERIAEEEPENVGDPVDYKFDADFYFGVRQSLVSIDSPVAASSESRAEDIEEDSASEHRAILRHASFCIRGASGECLLAFEIVGSPSGGRSIMPDYFLRIEKEVLEANSLLSTYEFLDDADSSYALVKVSMPGLCPERMSGKRRSTSKTLDEGVYRYLPLPPYMDEAFTDLRTAMNRIFYLGPLRAPAKRYYPIQADASLQNDVTGELLPILLRDRVNSTVMMAAPRTHAPDKCRLIEAVNWWLHFMRTGIPERVPLTDREIKIDSLQDVLVELGIKSAGGLETHALADSGFGYSQLLPIIVRGLILPAGNTLMVEQPEVHLNPALQVRLSDFIVAMSRVGKQFIIETHSEHIVNAIRAIAAEKPRQHVSGLCTVLYLEDKEGKPQLHKLSMLSDGTIPQLPSSFFGESAQLLGRILRAQKRV